jgi:hypothetical protein
MIPLFTHPPTRRNTRRNKLSFALLTLVFLTISLAGCTQKPAPEATPAVSPTLSPTPSPLSPPASVRPSPNLQTYREKSGLFQISFPRGYSHTVTASGVAFVSADQGFGGSIDYGPAEGKRLNSQQLEASLKAEMTNRLKEVNWQTTQTQPDGSLRIDWTGKDKTGNTLDAVSIVEQRGNTIFVLHLFGSNKPYQNYNTDAETIVNSYQIQPQTSPQVRPTPSQPTPSQPTAGQASPKPSPQQSPQ